MNQYEYDYLIIGGGLAADAAVRGIRSRDGDGTIGVISDESAPPYLRPALSKGLWQGTDVKSILRDTAAHGARLHLGRRAIHINPIQHLVIDHEVGEYRYGKLLLATGAPARRLPFEAPDLHYLRTLDDYARIRLAADKGARFVVVGGGFIGSEIAAALANHGNDVTLVFPEDGIGGQRFPLELSAFLDDYYRQHDVTVIPRNNVTAVGRAGNERVVILSDGRRLRSDEVVIGIGSVPATQLAATAGAEVSDGIVIDERLRTTVPDVFAAGDAARFHNPALGRAIRIEHEDNAKRMGEHAGRNMAGDNAPYHYLPFFYSDLFDLGYEAVGILDNRLEIVTAWEEPFRKGVVFYLDGGHVQGVLLWNTWGMLDAARDAIGRPAPSDRKQLTLGEPVNA